MTRKATYQHHVKGGLYLDVTIHIRGNKVDIDTIQYDGANVYPIIEYFEYIDNIQQSAEQHAEYVQDRVTDMKQEDEDDSIIYVRGIGFEKP